LLVVGRVVARWKVKSARSKLRFTAEHTRARAPFCTTTRSAHTSVRSTVRHKAEHTCLINQSKLFTCYHCHVPILPQFYHGHGHGQPRPQQWCTMHYHA
jgi:hypothetical protein